MSKQTQAFNDIMEQSNKEFELSHFYAHKYFTETLLEKTGISHYDLSDREKALVAYAIYVGLSMPKDIRLEDKK